MEASLQTTSKIPSAKQEFIPQETLDNPCDITLVVDGGKKFRAHRRVLSKASPFFEKLFNSDMRESQEGVVRLEMLTERGLSDILEFIYTGSVQISTEENAQYLIVMADYLLLPQLKTIAEKNSIEKLKFRNLFSTYYLAQRYRCEKLFSVTKNHILANFISLTKWGPDFMNLSSKEVKIWIANDEINVSAEEDVFKIILSWINHVKSERRTYFFELFSEVRLNYVSVDYLRNQIATNDLVNDNEGCMDLVRDALKLKDSKHCTHLSVKPRTSLQVPVILVSDKFAFYTDRWRLHFYFPNENSWSSFSFAITTPRAKEVVSCHDKIYFVSQRDKRISRYDPLSDRWTNWPYEERRKLAKVFVANEEIYALVSYDQSCCPMCALLRRWCGEEHQSFITKFKPDLKWWEWEDVTSFNLGSRVKMCVVAKDNCVYFLGGHLSLTGYILNDADRYDLNTNTWDKIAPLQRPRDEAFGAAVCDKVFIGGGGGTWDHITSQTCEVYIETTNEWHFIASMTVSRLILNPTCANATCSDGKLYVIRKDKYIECFDPERNVWKHVTRLCDGFYYSRFILCCSLRVFKGCKLSLQSRTFAGRQVP